MLGARFRRAPLTLGAGVALLAAPASSPAQLAAPAETEPAGTVAALAARAGDTLGPPGGEVRSLATTAADPRRLYAGTANGQLYVSRDRGAHWRRTALELPSDAVIDNLLVSATDPDRLYAAYWTPGGTGGLVLSADAGASWRRLPVPADPSLRALATAADPRILYVGGLGGVWRSDDGGDSWRNVNGRGLATDFVESLAVDPRDPDHVYAGTWRQVYRSRDGGATWRRVYQGMAVDRDIFSLALDPRQPDTLLAGTCNFLYRSDDGGSSWQERRRGLEREHNRVHVIVHDPSRPATLYAGTRGGVYRSDDRGETWRLLLGGVSVAALALAPDDQRLFVATEERGVLEQLPDGAFREANDGIVSSRVLALSLLPGAPRVLFAARADGPARVTIHLSTDAGATWRSLGAVPDRSALVTVQAQTEPYNRLLVATVRGLWSVSPSGRWAPLPAPAGRLRALAAAEDAARTLVAATDTGLYAAASAELVEPDGGAAPFDAAAAPLWRPLWQEGPIDALALAGDRLLALAGGMVVRGRLSAPAAELLAQPVSGLDEPALDLAVAPGADAPAYAVSRHQVYRSDDGGARWQRLRLPWPAAELRAVALDPAQPDVIVLLDYRGALYRGHDRGRHWFVLDQDRRLDRAWTMRISPDAPGLVWVGTQGYGIRVVDIDPLRLHRRAGAPAAR